ncbi:MAG: UvrD-helicase domain-containing protein [candidate division WOR-3 bacterium]|nr:MAG: UvrD-helicase domain-containing protein [candidate division WOR-3 bacterium]
MLLKNLGKYEIIEWLGGGRFGDVFLARDTIIDKNFALKISRMRREEIDMLRDEATLLASLDHPNIVRFYNIDFIENKFVLVMEYIEGDSLRDIITEGGIDIKKSLSILAQITDGLVYAHGCSVLHRDLKPENILISTRKNRDTVKITDFGLAKFIRADSISASSAGTPIYMAPESWSGSFSDKSDVWSLGVVLYEILTGAPPFLDDNLDGLRRKIQKASFVAPAVLRHNIPEQIEKLILSALTNDPLSRPSTAEILEKITQMEEGIRGEKVRIPTKKTPEIQLTPVQREVIESLSGQVFVHGQAGCGKTTTLTYAVNTLLGQGLPASRILICTFTNKAANDIRERLQKTNRLDIRDLWVGTLHTLGFRILRRDAERLDLNPGFIIKDAKSIIRQIDIDVGKYRINAVLRFIEMLKAEGITARDFEPKNDWEGVCTDVYRRYETHKMENSILDYDDLILLSNRLLEENSDIRRHYQDTFDHIFVDELQDINPAQYKLIGLLFNENIFFTGDADQAIYGWRGAKRELMHQVPKDYPKAKIFQLNRSFRLAQGIIDIAGNLMQREATAIPAGHESDVIVYAAKTEQDEADFVVKEIRKLAKGNFSYGDMVILCRMNQLALTYQEALAQSRMPHVLISGSSLYERSNLKPLLDYLEALKECHLHKETPDKFIARVKHIIRIPKRNASRAQKVYEYHLANGGLLEAKKLIDDIVELTGTKSTEVSELQFLAASLESHSLVNFLNQVRLVQELDLAEWNKDLVKVMTVHSAKGLEFPVVFVVELVEDVFPLTKKMSSPKEIEEERRLCYVALTRAQKKLYLLYPKWRHGRFQHPSRFLVEMFKTAS